MNNNTEIFKLLPCVISQIIFESNNDYTVALLVDEEKEIGLSLNNYDGSMLTFTDTGCADFAHIRTIHQMLLKFKESVGFKLKRAIIEAKYGDVIYCRLHWSHESKSIFNVCTIGDALILHTLSGCDLLISQNVADDFESFDTEGLIESYEN